MTDYDAQGFALRFRASRHLDPQTEQLWIKLLREAVPEGVAVRTVLDLGAGTGRFWPAIRRAWYPRRIIAFDQSADMLCAATLADDVEAVVADIDDEMIGRYRPEAVLCSMSLHYSTQPGRLCQRLKTMLGPQGVLCVRTACQETTSANAILGFFPSALQAELTAFPERKVIEGWLSEADFKVCSQVVRTPSAPGYRALVRRVLHRGLPSLQLVSNFEFALGMLRLGAWAAARAIRRIPVPHDETLLLVGHAA